MAWSLEKAKYFVLGHPDLIVAVDHQPLLKLLGDRAMEDIPNPRLFNLKEKTLRYRFSLTFIPGKSNHSADAASRPPANRESHTELLSLNKEDICASTVRHMIAGLRLPPSKEDLQESERMELHILGTAKATLAGLSTPQPVTWPRLVAASAGDSSVASLLSLIQSGLPENKTQWPEHLHDFFRHRESLSHVDGVILFKNRPLIPPSLRTEVLDLLHQGHQGVTSMALHAEQTVYWPHYKEDIVLLWLHCCSP